MNTSPATSTATSPEFYTVVDGSNDVVDVADTQSEAFGVIDWLTRTAPHAGPYRALPQIPEQRRP